MFSRPFKKSVPAKQPSLLQKLFSSQYRAIALSALILTVFYNFSFFTKLFGVFPLGLQNALFHLAVGIVLFLAIFLFLTLLASKYTTKPLLILSFLTASACGFYMANYGVIIDTSMVQNIVETDAGEVKGLFSIYLLFYILLLGILPSLIIAKWKIHYQSVAQELRSKAVVILFCLVTSASLIAMFSGNFISLFREYKPVRYYTNPTYPFYSTGKYFANLYTEKSYPTYPTSVSMDAQMVSWSPTAAMPKPSHTLMIMVVGEAARADHMQLNGYARETNPRLRTIKNAVSFSNVTSCGTSTAVSVPCMFSIFDRNSFNADAIYTHENALNVLKRLGVAVLWRDNNSSSKGVANHIAYEDYHHSGTNSLCDGTECRDEGMLVTLQNYINTHANQDILIVLHQFGSHGPEYYRRYPANFEHFTPVCKTNKLGDCTREEITNAYDNTLRYTDAFLAKVITLLKKNDNSFQTAMLYMSDHGESLGEGGLYLHGMPYAIAPKAQKHVAAVAWTGKHSPISPGTLIKNKDKSYSQDNLYCTLLSVFDVATKDCPAGKSMFYNPVTPNFHTAQTVP